MSLKRRLLRIFLVTLAVLLFVGYFAFSTFLFSPTEGSYRPDIATLVPRDVDFFLAKGGLADDFSAFPRLAVADRVEATPQWRAFKRSPESDQVLGALQLDGVLAEIENVQAQLHGLDPLGLFGGRDLAVAGYFRAKDLQQADWAAYGRVQWMGKLGTSLLRYPGLLELEAQGLRANVQPGWVELSGGQLPRPIYVARVRDVAIAGTSKDLVERALDLQARGGENSFGLGATYFDRIQNAPRDGQDDELELFVDWRSYSERAKLSGRWPDAASQDFLPSLCGKVFQVGVLKSLAGIVEFENGLRAHLSGELSGELMTPVQTRLYRTRGIERNDLLLDAAGLASHDSALFVCAQLRLADLLRLGLESAEPALRANLEDLLRSTGKFTGADALIDELDTLFRGKVGVVVRANDYVRAEADPPNDGQPVPAWAIVLWTDGSQKTRDRILELQNLVNTHHRRFGLQGATETERGVYTNRVCGGFEVWEFWSRLVPGTGHIATAIGNRNFIISNSYHMAGELLCNSILSAKEALRLSSRPEFAHMLQKGLPQANLVAWVDPKELARILLPLAREQAEAQVLGKVDWDSIRAEEERKVLAESFPGSVRGSLSPEVQQRVNEIVNPRLLTLEQQMRERDVPAARAAIERKLHYGQLVSGALAMIAFDPRKIDVSLSALMPLEAAGEP